MIKETAELTGKHFLYKEHLERDNADDIKNTAMSAQLRLCSR